MASGGHDRLIDLREGFGHLQHFTGEIEGIGHHDDVVAAAAEGAPEQDTGASVVA